MRCPPSGAGPRKSSRTAKTRALELRPTGIPAEDWRAWVEHQWARKRPTPTALESQRRRLSMLVGERGSPAARRFMAECIAANAQGIPAWAFKRALAGELDQPPAGQPPDKHDWIRRLEAEGRLRD